MRAAEGECWEIRSRNHWDRFASLCRRQRLPGLSCDAGGELRARITRKKHSEGLRHSSPASMRNLPWSGARARGHGRRYGQNRYLSGALSERGEQAMSRLPSASIRPSRLLQSRSAQGTGKLSFLPHDPSSRQNELTEGQFMEAAFTTPKSIGLCAKNERRGNIVLEPIVLNYMDHPVNLLAVRRL